ncbi:putative RNA-binding protein Luc7-like 1 isoform X5 [Leopardus geoffroyi]|uniref:RNA-binding protein Luc7-like 1 isoform X3 n=1 Tax=Acinonyx jubatus TaxID=32536 RepID=A0ABM3PC78_ACIJB|nr:putative RNA-binding protein Luc7-like 1 isoform X3 [Felis catus]XP_042778705.1 putative RNA-binding protein Luc7-like 1 isoform X4 [Panthera leo]XP_042828226.1 putative RNA-binding protein Luc7-like 1 isoform X4 [Panthera tigris]XP_045315951.1 putative RNA-binding protein Luc7-like 1 isoform X5 [Leopardus geoffroyi]XP_053069283.1 putative RNA-binding protein Luc7-like 1 isoform X3 [Acinonyx jubatus]XP_058566123.1 putative RNA-binding protein Luc7-like 1 isoform X4 [Neofelis nebulosa]XP_06
MSAQAQMRALLDQLMGTARDGDETRQRVKFTDDRVCKSHLLDCCPHDILAGTRMDLGECTKIHDLALRADYEIASKERDLFFELDAMDHLESFIAECDRRTELAKKRLAETQEEISAEVSAKAEKVHELNEEIGKLLAKAEQLGAEGNVDESQKILMEVEKVRAKKKEAEKTVAEKQEKRNQDRLRRREEREREERLSRRSGSRTRDRRRSRSRDRRRRRSRSTSRERRKSSRSRSRDRHRRHRSRSRSHSRGHRRASRDRSAKYKFSRERASREESWEHGRSERGAADWRLESSNGKTASRRSEEKEAGEI